MTSTQKELKEGLVLNETVHDDGTKEFSFTNSTVDKQFICKYGFKGATPEALGITKIEGEKWIVSVHPSETQKFVKGKWTGLTKSIATGPCSKEWLEKQAGAAKDSNAKELETVQAIIKKAGLKEAEATSNQVADLCEKEKVPFIDTNFMPLDCSMQAKWQKGEMKMFPFKRPSQWEVLTDAGLKPELFVNKIEPEDVNQGSLADCYFMGAIGSVATNEDNVRQIFSEKQNAKLGIYRLNMCKSAWWETVVVDDFLPCSGPKPAFARNRDEPNELWVALLEKAYSKLNGSYFAMKTGQCATALADLTGAPHKTMPMTDDAWDAMYDAHQNGNLQVLGTPGKNLMYVDEDKQSPQDKKMWDTYRGVELICEHSYSVLNLVETKKGRLVHLRNPWGTTNHGLWKGKWAADDADWTPALKKEVNYRDGDGLFWMCWEDCAKWFDSISTAYTLPSWETVRVKGEWKKGVPSVCVEIDVKEKTMMWVGLHQRDIRGLKPGSCADASYASMNFFLVAPKKDGVKVVESIGTGKRDRFSLISVDPEVNPKLFLVGSPKDAATEKNFVLSLCVETVSAVNLFFNKPLPTAKHYESAKDIVLADWEVSPFVHQLEGKTFGKAAGFKEVKGKQVGAGESASREVVSKKKAKAASLADTPTPAAASTAPSPPAKKAKVRSGSGPAAEKSLLSSPPAGAGKAALRSKTSAVPKATSNGDAGAAAAAPSPKALKPAVKTPSAISIEVHLISASGLTSKGSQNPFCELKLRTVSNGVIGSDHPNPQKQSSKVVNKSLSPNWGEKFNFHVPGQDCVRISIFGKKMMGKDYLGRVDLLAPKLAEELEKGSPSVVKTYTVSGEDENRGPVSGTVEIGLRLL